MELANDLWGTTCREVQIFHERLYGTENENNLWGRTCCDLAYFMSSDMERESLMGGRATVPRLSLRVELELQVERVRGPECGEDNAPQMLYCYD